VTTHLTEPEEEERRAGLCATCIHRRIVKTERSTFYLCQLSFTDPRYPKYPRLPVRACPGYEPEPARQP
jgi:hypothetical protein